MMGWTVAVTTCCLVVLQLQVASVVAKGNAACAGRRSAVVGLDATIHLAHKYCMMVCKILGGPA